MTILSYGCVIMVSRYTSPGGIIIRWFYHPAYTGNARHAGVWYHSHGSLHVSRCVLVHLHKFQGSQAGSHPSKAIVLQLWVASLMPMLWPVGETSVEMKPWGHCSGGLKGMVLVHRRTLLLTKQVDSWVEMNGEALPCGLGTPSWDGCNTNVPPSSKLELPFSCRQSL